MGKHANKNVLDPRPAEPAASVAASSQEPADVEETAVPAEAKKTVTLSPQEMAMIKPPAEAKPLTKLPEGWRQFSADGLSQLCRQAGLPAGGSRATLAKRLEVKFFGSATHHLNGRVKCRYCGSMARVTATRKLNEEGTIIERYYSCCGKRGHTFKIQEERQPEEARQAADNAGPSSPAAELNLQRFRKARPYL